MLSFRLKPEYHQNIFFFGLILMAVGLPFSKVLMSISQFVLIGNWLWEGDLRNKLKMFRHNKAALILSSLPLLYIFGIAWSTDINYAFNDIRIKLPLIILPLIFASSTPIDEKRFFSLMNIFATAVIAASFVSVAAYFGFTKKNVNDLRDISIFMSHIRFSLLICIAILFLFYSAINYSTKNFIKNIQFAAVLWLIVFLFFLESMTGLVALSVAVLVIFLFYSFRQNSITLKTFYLGIVLIIPVLFLSFLVNEIKDFFKVNTMDFSKLEEFSKMGEKYLHDTLKKNLENGNYVWIYYAPEELEQAWNKRSEIKFLEKDKRGQNISFTLMRFLTSKNFRKDDEGVQDLTDEEVKAIENGDANVIYLNRGFRTRINQIIWEINNYMEGENPQGNSITQRLEFWKAAWKGITNNPVLGAGTGELQKEMNFQFSKIKTLLEPKYWLKPHNQFITISVTFGFLGFSWFLIFLFAPGIIQRLWGDFFYTTFFVIALLSMLTEDTLDTQAGISFFTFFSCLFLFRKKNE